LTFDPKIEQSPPRAGGGAARLVLALVSVALIALIASRVAPDPREWAEPATALRVFAAERPVVASLGYLAVYTGFAALALPGVWVLNIAAGAMFGFGVGLPLAIAANTAGAVAAMLTARYLLREPAAARFPGFVAKVDANFARDGARWLLAARLAPVIPYSAVNVGAGLTRIGALPFAAISFAGSAPLTLLHVLAGAHWTQPRDGVVGVAASAMLVALATAALAAGPLARRLRRAGDR
jgi:uncharacterized membrane protein YdjX (TVP38/TMEM64 family)